MRFVRSPLSNKRGGRFVMEDVMGFSVCVVAYGNYPELLKRFLRSLAGTYPPGLITDLRIGLNSVCGETFQIAQDFCSRSMLDVDCHIYEPVDINAGKYPLMRRMFYDEQHPMDEMLMWFDDDSYLDDNIGRDWWEEARRAIEHNVMAGARHSIKQRGNQWQGIQEQPWFGGQKVRNDHVFSFITGGWWVAQTEFIFKWNYPFVSVFHNGGDSILGELVRQQGMSAGTFGRAKCHCESCERKRLQHKAGVVHINVGGTKGRRGIGKRGEVYPWQYHGLKKEDLSFHNFDVKIYRFKRE